MDCFALLLVELSALDSSIIAATLPEEALAAAVLASCCCSFSASCLSSCSCCAEAARFSTLSKDSMRTSVTEFVTIFRAPMPDLLPAKGFLPPSLCSFSASTLVALAAAAAGEAVAAAPGKKYNPLFIYGASGLGKTHLLHSIARDILDVNPKTPLVYVSAQQFAEEFVNALQNGRIDSFRKSQRAVAVWLVDDIQFIAGKDKTQEEIFHTFNYLYSLGKQIVLSSDRPPKDLFLMEERLRSRFESGLVADIQMPDTETRCAILLTKAAQERIELPHTIAMYLAENVPGNIRKL